MKKLILILTLLICFSFISFGNAIKDQEAFIEIAEKVMPAVVNINTERTVKQRYIDPFEEFFNDQFFGRRSIPKEYERKTTSLGSGFVISEDGYVITNNHVIDGATKIEITFNTKETYEAEVVGKDKESDIAVLKIKENNIKFKYIELGDSDNIKIGQWAIAIGNPFGLNNTMTLGIVSAKGRKGVGIENYEDFIQTDASINPGNSGGPLVDINGRVIGINTAILSRSGGNIGIGFAIPINMAKVITDSLIKDGKYERGWLGVQIQEVDKRLAEKFGLGKATGALITEVFENSPAQKSGLKRGDIVIEADGKVVENFNSFRNIIANTKPDSKIKLKVLRQGKETIVTAKVEKRSEQNLISQNEELNILGMKLKNLDEESLKKFGYKDIEKGVMIIEVENNSEAHSLGIKAGSIVAEINNVEINNIKDIEKIYNNVKDKEDILFYIISKNSNRYVILSKDK